MIFENKNKLYFGNPAHLKEEDIHYYAAYNYFRSPKEPPEYIGVFTKEELIQHMQTLPFGFYVYAYARKTKERRGKDGRYVITIETPYQTIVKHIKNKYYIKKCIYWNIRSGDQVTVLNEETGEVFEYNK